MDLIRKQEAIDEIRAFQSQITCSFSEEWLNGMDEGFDHAAEVIALMEPVELPIVRCKDCKHRYGGETLHNCCEVLMAMSNWLLEIPVEDNWYCGNGEKEEINE